MITNRGRAFIFTILCCSLWRGVAAAQSAPTYERMQELSALCEGPKLKAGVCATPADADAAAALCDARASPAALARAVGAPCATTVAAKGGAAPGALALPWVSVATDFFVARAKAELALFLKRRIAGSLCPEGSAEVALLPETCKLLAGSDVGLTSLPSSLRGDLSALPERLAAPAPPGAPPPGASAPPVLSDERCVADALARVYPALRDGGPLQALAALKDLVPHAGCEQATALKRLRATAAVLDALLPEVVALVQKGKPLDAAALLRAAKLLVVDRQAQYGLGDAEVTEIGQRVDEAAQKLLQLVRLLAELDDPRARDAEHVARTLDTAADLLGLLCSSSSTAGDLAELLRAISAFASGRYTVGVLRLGSVQAVKGWLDARPPAGEIWAGVLRFAGLIGSLAEARTSDEARAALEAAAAPVGSYREFRQGGWVAFLGGYAGLGGGVEWGQNVPRGTELAPLLPVGLELGHPLGKASSFNLLLSVADLGAVAATRLTSTGCETAAADGTVRSSPEEDLAGVLSPGLFASLGLGDTPFVIGLGAQYLPASRAIFECPGGGTCDQTRTEPILRFSIFAAIDLPAFRIF